jgi:hypothetical protein
MTKSGMSSLSMKCTASSRTGWAVLHGLLRMEDSLLSDKYEIVSSHIMNPKIWDACCEDARQLGQWVSLNGLDEQHNLFISSQETVSGLSDGSGLFPIHSRMRWVLPETVRLKDWFLSQYPFQPGISRLFDVMSHV